MANSKREREAIQQVVEMDFDERTQQAILYVLRYMKCTDIKTIYHCAYIHNAFQFIAGAMPFSMLNRNCKLSSIFGGVRWQADSK